MTRDEHGLASEVADIASGIDSSKKSNTKWKLVGEAIAEAAGLDPGDVYVTTVSKPGNLSVRLEQSRPARAASIAAVMYTGDPAELEKCISAAERICIHSPRLYLIFDGNDDAQLLAVVKPTALSIPPAVASAFPSAAAIDC